MIRGQKANINLGSHTNRSFKAEAGIHNRFDVEVVHPDGSTDKAVGFNIMLDAIWSHLEATYSNWFGAISYGSGNGTLAYNRTDLFARIGTKAATNLLADYSHFNDGYVSFRQQIQIGAGEITGQVLREVGISYDTSAGHLMTHALLKDMNGNTVSITVGSLDIINIYATVFVRFSITGYESGGIVFTPSRSAWSIFAYFAGVAGGSPGAYMNRMFGFAVPFSGRPPIYTLGDTGGEYGGTSSWSKENWVGCIDTTKAPATSFVASSRTLKIRCSLAVDSAHRFGVNDCNPSDPGGWNSLAYFSGSYGDSLNYARHLGINVFFPNNAKPYCTISNEALGTGDGSVRDFTTKFGFILNDGSAAVKINGTTVPSGDYTTDYGKPAHQKIQQFLRRVSGTKPFWHCRATMAGAIGDYDIVENPFYATYGMTTITKSTYGSLRIDCSDDLSNWTLDVLSTLATHKNARYWRVWCLSTDTMWGGAITAVNSSDISLTTVHFAAGKAPASGAAVTMDYRTASICKDTNHVVDIELEITASEYTG